MIPPPPPNPATATAASPRRIVAFSFYADGREPQEKYLLGMRDNLAALPDIYPGWVPVVFLSTAQERFGAEFRAAGAIVRLRLPDRGARPMFWRFLAADKYQFPNTDAILIRDCDSVVNVREAAAVGEWMESCRRFHIMHDYEGHTHPINGGMWGVRGSIPGIERMVDAWAHNHGYGDDLRFLADRIRPLMTPANTLRHAGPGAPPNFLPGTPFPKHPPWAGYVGCPVTRHADGSRFSG